MYTQMKTWNNLLQYQPHALKLNTPYTLTKLLYNKLIDFSNE